MDRQGFLIGTAAVVLIGGGIAFQMSRSSPGAGDGARTTETVSNGSSETAPASPDELDPAATEGRLCLLKGSDFSVECLADQDEVSERITIRIRGGKFPEFVESDGKTDHPVTTLFSREDHVSLGRLIPGEPREQMIVEGGTVLPQGQGAITTRNIYRIEEKGIREVAHLILSRTPGEDSPEGSRSLSAKAEVTSDGVIRYEATIDGGSSQMIELKWDGERFKDPTGEFEKLSQEFTP